MPLGHELGDDSGGKQASQGFVKACQPTFTRVIGGQHGHILPFLEVIDCQGIQNTFGADLDKNTSSTGVEGLHGVYKLNR